MLICERVHLCVCVYVSVFLSVLSCLCSLAHCSQITVLPFGCCSRAQCRGSRGFLSPGVVPLLLLSPGTASQAPLRVGLMGSVLGPTQVGFAALSPPALQNKPCTDDVGSNECCQRAGASHVLYPLASLNALIKFLCLVSFSFLPEQWGSTGL